MNNTKECKHNSVCDAGYVRKRCTACDKIMPDEVNYPDCVLSFEQVSFEVSLCLKALPVPENWNVESISKEVAKHLCLTSENIKRLK